MTLPAPAKTCNAARGIQDGAKPLALIMFTQPVPGKPKMLETRAVVVRS